MKGLWADMRAELENLRDKSINSEGVSIAHYLIKISVGGQKIIQLLVLVLSELKGLKFELLVMVLSELWDLYSFYEPNEL